MLSKWGRGGVGWIYLLGIGRVRLYLWKQPEDIRIKIGGTGWVFHFSNRFLGQKLLDRERLVSWSIVMVENPIVGPKFRPFYTHSFTFHTISLVDWPCGMNPK
jgi:hypothetical protein